ncbi:carbohydrate ABC transporter permease [Haloarcula litorea]|uniref:carbohydrate ABC transporter permease n=1 Tax=Haloarcula litorea TaxID=3032579 RepID=UPI0023E86213|nr:carbohydrate ABC transporter permease [Halomicroarcula sp. GDY20]
MAGSERSLGEWVDRSLDVESYKRGVFRRPLLHGALIGSLLVMLLPVVMTLLMSTQPSVQISSSTLTGVGSEGLSNYEAVLFEENFATYLVNSFVMALAVAVGKVGIALLAALALVYYDLPFKRLILLFILFTLALPVPVRIVPMYEIMVSLDWENSMLGLVTPYFASATSVLLLRQHFRSISASMVESAKLDGVGPLKFLVYVLIPMSRSMIAGLFAIAFIWGWNQYLWPLIIINDQSKQVLQVGLAQLNPQAGEALWGLIMAGAVITLLVPLLLMITLREPLLDTVSMQTK